MVQAADAAQLEAQRQELIEISRRPAMGRLRAYLGMSGPGILQGALTLGGGSLAASLYAGALMGYDLLWVQPVAMLFGVVLMQALAHQALSTGMRPFVAVQRFVHPSMAWAWALASLLASMVWALPQYNLAAMVVDDMAKTAGASGVPGLATAIPVLLLSIAITWGYNRGGAARVWFERTLRFMVAGIVLAFGAVVVNTGVDWGAAFKGLLGFHIPWPGEGDPTNGKGFDVLLSAFATAVGINMTFLFPYTLLARGWGREHRGLARFDVSVGLFVPFVICTSLVVIATANVLHPNFDPADPKPGALEMAAALEPAFGGNKTAAHWVFGLGVLGMTVSTIPLLMLVCGFIAVEIFKVDPKGNGYRLATLLPAVGILGPVVWRDYNAWMAIPTSVIGFVLMPIAYISFLVLQNRRAYLGEDRPSGRSRLVWNLVLGVGTLLVTVGSIYKVVKTFS